VQQYTHKGEGFLRQYENSEWTIAIKNHTKASGEEYVKHLEKHLETDEFFILLQGKCIMISAAEENDGLKFEFIDMQIGTLYMIPQDLWHNTITYEDTKLVVVENANTSWDNSEKQHLKKELIKYR
jgi:mannose-6-phosphate isomerase-like protein (cupin superfamily)